MQYPATSWRCRRPIRLLPRRFDRLPASLRPARFDLADALRSDALIRRRIRARRAVIPSRHQPGEPKCKKNAAVIIAAPRKSRDERLPADMSGRPGPSPGLRLCDSAADCSGVGSACGSSAATCCASAVTSLAVRSMVGAGRLRLRAPFGRVRCVYRPYAFPRRIGSTPQAGNNANGVSAPIIKPTAPAKAQSVPPRRDAWQR